MTAYQGSDELVILEELRNYNSSICKKIAKHISSPNKTVIDFGAGRGTLAKILRNGGFDINCVEIDPNLQSELRSNHFKTYSQLSDLQDQSCDFVYSSNVLEHIEDDREALLSIFQKLKPSGQLYLYLPAFSCLYTDFDKKIGHYRRYHYKDLNEKLSQAGFQIQEWGYADSLGFFATYILKFLDNGKTIISARKIQFYDKVLFPISKLMDVILSPFFGKNIYFLVQKA